MLMNKIKLNKIESLKLNNKEKNNYTIIMNNLLKDKVAIKSIKLLNKHQIFKIALDLGMFELKQLINQSEGKENE